MTRRNKGIAVILLSTLLAATSFALLAVPRTAAQGTPPVTLSGCQIEMQTMVTPERLALGGTADVTLLMQHGCPEHRKPVDLVFLVDVSNSMTRGGPVRPGDDVEPAPSDPTVPDPGKGDPPAPEPPPPAPPGPVPPAPFALALDVLPTFDLGVTPDQEPVPPADPGEPPVKPPPPAPADPPAPGDPGTTTRPGASGSEPAGCEDTVGGNTDPSAPGGPSPVNPATPRVPPAQPGEPTRAAPTRTPAAPSNQPGTSTTGEPAGTEDLVRLAKQFIKDFVEQPRIEKDLADGSLRLGLVAFSDRGRRLVSLTSDGARISTRTNLLRGGGKTRIDLGMRTAERVLIDPNRRFNDNDDRVKVIVVISDAAFCQKDLRVKVDRAVEVVTLLAGRSPWGKRMRDIATDTAYVLNMRPAGLQDLLRLYMKDFAEIRPVDMETLTIGAELQPNMELVAGSINPVPATQNGRAMTWVWTPPTEAVTVTFKIKPLQGGFNRVDVDTTSAWTDTEKLPGLEHFPAYYVDVLGGPASPTPRVEPTPTPFFAP